jgi:hypothetical protein
MEGGIGFGLGSVLHEELTLTDGVVDQANYDAYLPLRIDEMRWWRPTSSRRRRHSRASASRACRRSVRRRQCVGRGQRQAGAYPALLQGLSA